jgi:hypothetical protein
LDWIQRVKLACLGDSSLLGVFGAFTAQKKSAAILPSKIELKIRAI